ncbi:hypothetical protein Ahy_B09g095589 isoform B [Arachis hypogaea]|uniref:Uncharacterized protein n=1 Tax=Arachis hypogaea TaxID=3818 RepID=A0A444XF32_ARAHY|nr:hypothetical protein Ahy_B09g095589 isoform B [Arachis hypogaea]
MADSSTSSTSQSASKTRKPFHFRAKIKVQNIQVIVRNLRQNTIKLSIKNLKRKQSNNTQQKMAARNQTKDLKCATHLLSDKFRNMSEEKKAIVRDLGFGGLMHIPPLKVDHQLLRELANNFKLGENRLKTGYGSFQITPKTIGDALGINATDYKEKKKKAIDGCLFALMIIYFHLSKNKGKKRAERPPKPWIANWTKEHERYEISSDELDEWLRQNVDKSAAEGENQADLRSTEGRYVSSET